jgi:glycosyltransferase involved in cell wall biosynthesis
MSTVRSIAFIGNSLPRRCGIATFTTDLQQAMAATSDGLRTVIVAMSDKGLSYDYPPAVGFEVRDDKLEDYLAAADFLNTGGYDVVSLQHEFGIFGGEAGEHVMTLLSRLTMPVVTTLHTVLAEPSSAQRRVLERIIAVSARLVVMAEKGRDLLLTTYAVPSAKIDVIPHGIPDFAFVEPHAAKAKLGFSNKTVILTFGLLSPNKGIEVMIDAMPHVLATRPDATYVVLGATHPTLVREQGEAYRQSLMNRVSDLGIEDHVVFLNQFVDRPTLLDFISMSDIYVTPYLNPAQMTSGTLAYSFGLGKAVVSTPYWHARELLSDNRGVLVPFGDSAAIGTEIAALFDDDARRQAMRRRAYADSRSMTWERVAENYLTLSGRVRDEHPVVRTRSVVSFDSVVPEIDLTHLEAMSDDVGLYQHAVHAIPDRSHGYCVDDNARGLLLAASLGSSGETSVPDRLTNSFAAFVQHAWNPDARRFRNFMSFDRRWLEDQGSEDSHGRTLWALGVTAGRDPNPLRRNWAKALFADALPAVGTFHSPRAWAFTLLGLDAQSDLARPDPAVEAMRQLLAGRLMRLFDVTATAEWTWFEDGLAYDNARLPQALVVIGLSSGVPEYVAAGIKSLDWLTARQVSPEGLFRPVGTEGFGDKRQEPKGFDQQPVEAAATIAACLAAWRASSDNKWIFEARRAFAWFHGRNDLHVSLIDPNTGGCCDGLHPDRRNENQGGESVVSYLLGLADIRRIARIGAVPGRVVPLRSNAFATGSAIPNSRGRLVASHVPEPAGTLPQA